MQRSIAFDSMSFGSYKWIVLLPTATDLQTHVMSSRKTEDTFNLLKPTWLPNSSLDGSKMDKKTRGSGVTLHHTLKTECLQRRVRSWTERRLKWQQFKAEKKDDRVGLSLPLHRDRNVLLGWFLELTWLCCNGQGALQLKLLFLYFSLLLLSKRIIGKSNISRQLYSNYGQFRSVA